MLLAIDIGNTNTVFAVYKGIKLLHAWRCQSISARTADEYAVFISELFKIAKIGWDDIADVIVSSVVPEANFHIRNFCMEYFKFSPLIIGSDDIALPIEVSLNRPEEVGADRIVNAMAIIEHYSHPAIVVDFGTATTFDVIDKEGRYSGGAIAPGINISVDALHHAAAKLPRVSVKKPASVIGKDTVSAMQSGVFWGYLGLIERMISEVSEEMQDKPFVLATGGLADLFSENTDAINKVDHDLTLKGLLRIYQDHKKQN